MYAHVCVCVQLPWCYYNCLQVLIENKAVLIIVCKYIHIFPPSLVRGPTRVNLKQSLWLNFSIDTTKREFGAMEFLIFSDWGDLDSMSPQAQSDYLAQEEAREPLYTLPAGFRSVGKGLNWWQWEKG